LRNKKPPIAANAVTAVVVAPENGALRKNLGSMSGSSRRGGPWPEEMARDGDATLW
jgi:hypothetical protein